MTDNLPVKQEDRQNKFIGNLFAGMNIRQAALKAGYSKQTASKSIYTTLRSPRTQQKIREYAITHELTSLPDILKIEDKAIKQVLLQAEINPESIIGNLSKLRHTLDSKKRIAGILSDQPAKSQTLNVTNIQHLMVEMQEDNTQEAEIIEDT